MAFRSTVHLYFEISERHPTEKLTASAARSGTIDFLVEHSRDCLKAKSSREIQLHEALQGDIVDLLDQAHGPRLGRRSSEVGNA